MAWTDERIDLLKALWKDGLSASQIAKELAGGVSRNAVISKIHRLNLSGRIKPKTELKPRVYKPAKVIAIRPRINRPPIAVLELPEPEAPIEITPFGQRCTLFDLNEARCRWPVGDPGSDDFFFCGGGATANLPYCSYHSRVAYEPARPRKRDYGWRPRR